MDEHNEQVAAQGPSQQEETPFEDYTDEDFIHCIAEDARKLVSESEWDVNTENNAAELFVRCYQAQQLKRIADALEKPREVEFDEDVLDRISAKLSRIADVIADHR